MRRPGKLKTAAVLSSLGLCAAAAISPSRAQDAAADVAYVEIRQRTCGCPVAVGPRS